MSISEFVEKASSAGWNPGRNNPHKNMYCIIEGVVVVKLNNEKHMIIDESDISILDSYTWYFNEGNKSIRHTKSYVTIQRHILGIEDKHSTVTHKNGNLFDNRRSNLSVISRAQFKSMLPQANNKSGIVGIHFSPPYDSWIARIQRQGEVRTKSFRVSNYTSKEDALLAASEWRKQMMKELGI